MAKTVVSALKWWARAAADRDAFVFEDERLTYKQVDERTSRIARFLHDEGIKKGDRVVLRGANSNEWAVIALGIIKAGAVIVPANNRLTPTEIQSVIDFSEAVLLIDDGADKTLSLLSDRCPDLKTFGFDVFAQFVTGRDEWFGVETDAHDLVAILFTSGSTGAPKGVMQTNESVMGVIFETLLVEEGYGQGKTSLLALPLAFTPGVISGIMTTIVTGGTLIIEKTIDPVRALRVIEEESVSAMFGVPFMWEALTKVPEFESAKIDSVKSAWVGGAGVPVQLLNQYAAKGVKLRQIYGCSEVGGISTATMLHESNDHPDSCGIGSVFSEIKLLNSDGQVCAPGEQGEILLRSPGRTAGYYNDPVATESVYLDEGWLKTNDLGVIDAEGRLTFVDRMKDLIISGGINISPLEIEQVIIGVPGVAEVTVIATADEKFGEAPVAIVSVTEKLTEADILAHCEEVLADYKLPRYVVIKDEPLPRMSNGKLAKMEIRAEYQNASERFEKIR